MRKLSLMMLACGCLSMPAFAQQAAPASPPGLEGMPKTHAEWVAYLSDFTRNAEMMADPKKFVAAMNAMSEPGFLAIAMKAVMDPNLYARSMASAMDPRAYGNYARLMDPASLMAWGQAMADPQFVNAMMTVVGDPAKLMRWMTAPVDPNVTTMALGLLMSTPS